MIPYASRTGTRRNLAALRAAGWRLMVSAKGALRAEGFPYAIDNGAWSAYVAGEPFDEPAFLRAYGRLGHGADFVVLPDIVAGGGASLAFSLAWRARLDAVCPQMLAVQDGMTPAEVGPLVGQALGIFVGGTSEWKEATMALWGAVARERGAKLHVGRVNSRRRVALCAAAGADSFDGSSVSRYAVTIGMLDSARRQPDLLAGGRMLGGGIDSPLKEEGFR